MKVVKSYPVNNADHNGLLVTINLDSLNKKDVVAERKKRNYVVIVDCSGSMDGYISCMQDILRNWLLDVPFGFGIKIIIFSSAAEVIFSTHQLDESSKTQGMIAIGRMRAMSLTNIESGIRLAEEMKFDNNHETRTVILTDGAANEGITNAKHLAARCVNLFPMDAIMFTTNSSSDFVLNLKELNNLNNGYFATNQETLKTVFNQIFDSFTRGNFKVQIKDQVQTIPSTFTGSEIDLFFSGLKSDENNRILITDDKTKGIVFEVDSTDSNSDLLQVEIMQKLEVVLTMAKMNIITKTLVKETNPDYVFLNSKLNEIMETMLKLEVTDVGNTPTYRSLSSTLDDIKAVIGDSVQDPGPCDVEFDEVEVADEQNTRPTGVPVFRSLGASCGFHVQKKFKSSDDEQKYNNWIDKRNRFMNSKTNSRHAILSLKCLPGAD